MKKGFFSHQLCYRRSLLNKHILYLTFDNKVDNILPFQREVSLTTFCEGVLFVVSPGFEQEKEEFCRILREQLSGNPLLTVGEAIIHNPVYLRNMADDIAPCSLYTVTSINWATARLRDDELTLVKVLWTDSCFIWWEKSIQFFPLLRWLSKIGKISLGVILGFVRLILQDI